MNMWMIWLIAAIIFAVIEILTPSFFIIWFSGGSLAALVTSLFTDNIAIQVCVFIAVSAILILSTKKLTDKYLHMKDTYKTNTDKLIGQVGIVTETISPMHNKGRVKVQGESWKATTSLDKKINKDTEVVVEAIDGVTLQVKEK